MGYLPTFFDSFYSNPETQVAKLRILTGVGGRRGRGLGQTLEAVSWYLESAKSGLLAYLVSSLHRDGKDLGYLRHKTSLRSVALCFAEFSSLQSLSVR